MRYVSVYVVCTFRPALCPNTRGKNKYYIIVIKYIYFHPKKTSIQKKENNIHEHSNNIITCRLCRRKYEQQGQLKAQPFRYSSIYSLYRYCVNVLCKTSSHFYLMKKRSIFNVAPKFPISSACDWLHKSGWVPVRLNSGWKITVSRRVPNTEAVLWFLPQRFTKEKYFPPFRCFNRLTGFIWTAETLTLTRRTVKCSHPGQCDWKRLPEFCRSRLGRLLQLMLITESPLAYSQKAAG